MVYAVVVRSPCRTHDYVGHYRLYGYTLTLRARWVLVQLLYGDLPDLARWSYDPPRLRVTLNLASGRIPVTDRLRTPVGDLVCVLPYSWLVPLAAVTFG